jgi:plastocyanin
VNLSHGQSNTTSDNTSNVTNNGGIASEIFQNKILTFGDNVKNIILLLPNEGHESPALPKEQRIINQPYVPENIVVSPNTQIVWLNGDVGHMHTITLLNENSKQVYSSGKFAFNSVTNALVLNDTGKFTYSEGNVNKDDPKFVMVGSITVQENPTSPIQLPDTVGFIMVPAKDLDKHVSDLAGKGIDIIDKFIFKDLRGGQKGTGTQQTLLVLGSKNGQEQLVSALESITPTLPYS